VDPQGFGELVERFGLPIAILVVLGILLIRRIIVLGSELNYVEARRVEEREGRLAAEAALRSITERSSQILEAIAKLPDLIVDELGDRSEPRARR